MSSGKRPGGEGEAGEGRRRLEGRAGGRRSELEMWGGQGRPVEALGPQKVIKEPKRARGRLWELEESLAKAQRGP